VATIAMHQLTKHYKGAPGPAVDSLDLEVADGEFMVFVGPSGCGKTTSLRMLAGLEGVDGGTIHIADRDVTREAPSRRDISMVFQNYVLYPHLTVRQNIGFHLMIAKVSKTEIARRVQEAAELLGLTDVLDRRPARLSGGQRQRVAMGRAIVRQPSVLLMDEPLSNLDAKLRVATRVRIAELQRRLETTTVYVTHDQVEAMTMGDRVAVMKDGVLQQCDTPLRLYDQPANEFVAGFIGSPQMNLVPAVVDGEGAVTGPLRVPLTPGQRSRLRGPHVTLGLRPSALSIANDGDLPATVNVVEHLGSHAFAYCTADLADGPTQLVVRSDVRLAHGDTGRVVTVRVDRGAGGLHVFDGVTGSRLDG
jgi:multiple sugar transport system ATP-binding protein